MRSRLQVISSFTALLFVATACGDGESEGLSAISNSITYSQVASVTASAHDGNRPENAVDGRMDTRWSAAGAGAWIDARLASPDTIADARRGDEAELDFLGSRAPGGRPRAAHRRRWAAGPSG